MTCGKPVEFTVRSNRDETREVCATHVPWGLTELPGARVKAQDAVTSGCQAPKGWRA